MSGEEIIVSGAGADETPADETPNESGADTLENEEDTAAEGDDASAADDETPKGEEAEDKDADAAAAGDDDSEKGKGRDFRIDSYYKQGAKLKRQDGIISEMGSRIKTLEGKGEGDDADAGASDGLKRPEPPESPDYTKTDTYEEQKTAEDKFNRDMKVWEQDLKEYDRKVVAADKVTAETEAGASDSAGKEKAAVNKRWGEIKIAGKEKFKDFGKVVGFLEEHADALMSPIMRSVCFNSEVAPELYHALGKDLENTERIFNMPDPIDQQVEIRIIEKEIKQVKSNSNKNEDEEPHPEPVNIMTVSGNISGDSNDMTYGQINKKFYG